MSTFERDDYQWRETYFVTFPAARRPTRAEVESALGAVGVCLEIENLMGDAEGNFETAMLLKAEVEIPSFSPVFVLFSPLIVYV